jgi:hypothetical protein
VNKPVAYAAIGGLLVAFVGISVISQNQSDALLEASKEKSKEAVTKKQDNLEIGKRIAKDMAAGEVILMASCLGKEGAIPREKMGDYIAAALARQGISRQELFDNWDRYFGYAKEAEKRNRTSCLL